MSCQAERRRLDAVPEPGVVIAGAGPAGWACALALSWLDIPCILLDKHADVEAGSRATGVSRRSLQLLTSSGVAERVMDVAVVQVANQAYVGSNELFLDPTPPEPGKYPRVVNIPQNRFEEIVLAAIRERPSIDLRWNHLVTAVRAGATGVEVDAETPGGTRRLRADWLVACDGAGSDIRRSLGLTFSGPRYEARFIVTDVAAAIDLPDGVRRIWFDPPSNPGGTIIMHQQPENVWRIDFGIPATETAGNVLAPESVRARIAAHLEMLDFRGRWELVWSGDYRASSVTLESYRHGRVFLAGDAAHLIPIFGGRGLNSAVEDGFNLGWKLAAVLRGGADEALLDTYSVERVEGARQNLSKAGIGAELIATASPGSLVLRRAALGLMLDRRPSLRTLLSHRTTDANTYCASPLNLNGGGAMGGPRPGSAMPDARARCHDGEMRFLSDVVGEGFTVLDVTAGTGVPSPVPGPQALFGLPLAQVSVESTFGEAGEAPYEPGAYLIRPDKYVMGARPPGRREELLDAARAMPFAPSEASEPS